MRLFFCLFLVIFSTCFIAETLCASSLLYSGSFWPTPGANFQRTHHTNSYGSITALPRLAFSSKYPQSSSKFEVVDGGKGQLYFNMGRTGSFSGHSHAQLNAQTGHRGDLVATPGSIEFVDNKGFLIVYGQGSKTISAMNGTNKEWSVSTPGSQVGIVGSNFVTPTRTEYYGAIGNIFWSSDQFGLLWSFSLPDATGALGYKVSAQVAGSRLALDTTGQFVYLYASYNDVNNDASPRMYCIDVAQRKVAWFYPVGRYRSPNVPSFTLAGSQLILVTDGSVVSIDAKTGDRLWTQNDLPYVTLEPVATQNAVLAVFDGNFGTFSSSQYQGVVAISLKDGTFMYNVSVPTTEGYSPSAPATNRGVGIFGAGRSLYVFDTNSGEQLYTALVTGSFTGSAHSSSSLRQNAVAINASGGSAKSMVYTSITTSDGSVEFAGFTLEPQANALCCIYAAKDGSPAAVCNYQGEATCPSIEGFNPTSSSQVGSCQECFCN